MGSAIKKSNMISQIVRLKQFVKRWKCKSLKTGSILCYSSADSDEATSSNRRTPAGSIAVYVGPERRRFVIPMRYLNLPVFVALLDQAEEEFGFQSTGGLALPCEAEFFSFIIRLLEEDEEKYRGITIDEFLKMVVDSYDQSSCKGSSSSSSSPLIAMTPMLNRARV